VLRRDHSRRKWSGPPGARSRGSDTPAAARRIYPRRGPRRGCLVQPGPSPGRRACAKRPHAPAVTQKRSLHAVARAGIVRKNARRQTITGPVEHHAPAVLAGYGRPLAESMPSTSTRAIILAIATLLPFGRTASAPDKTPAAKPLVEFRAASGVHRLA